LGDADVDRMVADAEKYRAQDKELAKKHVYKTKLERALVDAKEKAEEVDELTELAQLMDWMELDSAEASLEELMKRGKMLEEKYGMAISV
jgi:molecular chaperone DnaK (HSP70)